MRKQLVQCKAYGNPHHSHPAGCPRRANDGVAASPSEGQGSARGGTGAVILRSGRVEWGGHPPCDARFRRRFCRAHCRLGQAASSPATLAQTFWRQLMPAVVLARGQRGSCACTCSDDSNAVANGERDAVESGLRATTAGASRWRTWRISRTRALLVAAGARSLQRRGLGCLRHLFAVLDVAQQRGADACASLVTPTLAMRIGTAAAAVDGEWRVVAGRTQI